MSGRDCAQGTVIQAAARSKRRHRRRLGGAAVLVAALLACATCTHGEITVVEPGAKGPNDKLALTILPGETQAAAELGWGSGIPGAEVIIAPSVKPNPDGPGDTATGPPIATLVTDSAGYLNVPDLPAGWYYVEVHRWLTAAERARLAPGADLIGFATQEVVQRGSATLTAPGSYRRSIVISEVSNYWEWDPVNGCCYTYGDYLELANNADTTVYLDGLVLALFGTSEEVPWGGQCDALMPFNNDPDGVWVFFADSLPGTGRDYPLAPGAVALIATDAIDHRANSLQDGLDLSHADFELTGDADVDNPSVPNSVPIGWNDRTYDTHGVIFDWGLSWGIVVALPVNTASLPKRMKLNHLAARLPRDRILDVVLAFWPNSVTVYNDLCPTSVNSAFDRRPAPLMINNLPGQSWHTLGQYSVQRKVAYSRSDGRKILQHTRTTEADFYVGLRTPFQLP